MTPQVSNRQSLLEGALRCLSQRDYSEVTTREIAKASSANIASIRYHFGSKDNLVAEALAEGFRQWLAQFAIEAGKTSSEDPRARLASSLSTLEERLDRQKDLARAFVAALSRAAHSEELRATLAQVFAEMRSGLSSYLQLDSDGLGEVRASVLIAIFDGLLIQWLLDPEQGKRFIGQLPALLETMPDSLVSS